MSYRGKERHKSLILESTGANLADITATAAEINITDGVTATAAEINALAGVTAGTSAASKAVVLSASSKINALDITAPKINGTSVTATASEINALAVANKGVVVRKITETVAFGAFTGAGAVGTYDLTAGTLPAGAYVLGASITVLTGFAGDTSAVLTIGDGTDEDRYNTGSIDVFSTAATGLDVGVPSGLRFHPLAKTPKITITTNAAWASVSAGSVSVVLYYLD